MTHDDLTLSDPDLLLAARDLIAQPNGWCQRQYRTTPNEDGVTAYCLIGSILAVTGEPLLPVNIFVNPHPTTRRLLDTYVARIIIFSDPYRLPTFTPRIPISTYGVWNDSPTRTQEQVIQALDDAARLAKEATTNP